MGKLWKFDLLETWHWTRVARGANFRSEGQRWRSLGR